MTMCSLNISHFCFTLIYGMIANGKVLRTLISDGSSRTGAKRKKTCVHLSRSSATSESKWKAFVRLFHRSHIVDRERALRWANRIIANTADWKEKPLITMYSPLILNSVPTRNMWTISHNQNNLNHTSAINTSATIDILSKSTQTYHFSHWSNEIHIESVELDWETVDISKFTFVCTLPEFNLMDIISIPI